VVVDDALQAEPGVEEELANVLRWSLEGRPPAYLAVLHVVALAFLLALGATIVAEHRYHIVVGVLLARHQSRVVGDKGLKQLVYNHRLLFYLFHFLCLGSQCLVCFNQGLELLRHFQDCEHLLLNMLD